MTQYATIAELQNFIVLNSYTKAAMLNETPAGYQTEAQLESELIADLRNQGYEYLPNLNSPQALLDNARVQLQTLNNIVFTDAEWKRFNEEFLNKENDSITDQTRKIQGCCVYDFTFDDGHLQNITLIDKQNHARNKLQVINQFEQTGTQANRYDVTILVNGLPMVQVELKKRGVNIREAFNQVHRYSKESFNSNCSLYKYLQIFVISNGTDTRYFANTVKRNKNSFDFTMNWATFDNKRINDLKDFTATFLQKNTLMQVLFTYSVFDVNNTLLIMRPYQIAATERLIWKITSSYQAKLWSKPEGWGYVWHTTGSGKTLTSFKAARLATELDFIDKVFFVVDRKDLDHQTMREYNKFAPDSVNGSISTAELKRNILKKDNRIIVTTIQKLNNLMKSEANLEVYGQQVVFIFDECHRSQFGEAQKNLQRKFKRFYQFGFTGTPIFPENAAGAETTAHVFGRELHAYVITDAIRDEKVLKFKVDYNAVRPQFKSIETEQDELKLKAAENAKLLLHPERIKEVSQYVLQNFRIKTHRSAGNGKGFNAMFAVSSVEAAKLYYEELNRQQRDSDKKLKIATIFSFAANEEQAAAGEIADENFEVTAMNSSAKEFLTMAINDYNAMFKTNYSVDSNGFQNYYRNLSDRVKNQEVDLLIVVGMFLTGFDAPTLNTLFVDKNLRYHGLIQAFSRTNRIYDATKTFGNIITFRDLEQATVDAISLFGDANTKNVVLEKSYNEYMLGFMDIVSGEAKRGYVEVVKQLKEQFPNPTEIETDADKKAFVKLFGEYLKVENVLQNYDEFTQLKDLQYIDKADAAAVEAFRDAHFLTAEQVEEMMAVDVLADRAAQDYRSTYNDIREWLRRQGGEDKPGEIKVDWDDVVFEVDLLKSQEINLDYILELVFEHNISQTDLEDIEDKAGIIDAFFDYAQQQQKIEAEKLIADERLNVEAAKRYMQRSLKNEYASVNGTGLNDILPKMSPLNPQFLPKKRTVLQKIVAFVEKFKGVGGTL